VPRDREGSFEPQIVKKRQCRLTGVEGMVIEDLVTRAGENWPPAEACRRRLKTGSGPLFGF
jgi:hypothetical protein